MKKRILAMVLALAMVFTLVSVSAATNVPSSGGGSGGGGGGGATATRMTVKKAIEQYGADMGLSGSALKAWLTREVDVPLEMQVSEADTNIWAETVTVRERKDTTIPAFDFKATLEMSVVKDKFDELVAAAMIAINAKGADPADLETIPVTGSFTITIVMPDGITVPDAYKADNKDMFGFNDESKNIFEETSRTFSANEATIAIKVKDGQTKETLEDVIGNDITFTVKGVDVATFGTYRLEGKLEGLTNIGGDADENKIATVNYITEPTGELKSEMPNYDAAVVIAKKTSGGSTGGGGGTPAVTKYTVKYVSNGGTEYSDETYNRNDTVNVDKKPVKDGYEFEGWYYDAEFTKAVPSQFKIVADTVLYAKYEEKSQGDGGNTPPALNADDHFAYIIGYVDGTVRPLNNIVRDEVATIFFRLLTEEAGESMHKEVAPFSDVPATRWSSTAIATLANGGYITGRPDGTFAPSEYITRAEFATIAARFMNPAENSAIEFSDVQKHWAKNYIEACAANGIITGYEDGTFKPDQYITRAEVMAIVNRMLNRSVDAEGIKDVADDIYYFGDNKENTWCYYIVLEATNSHDYTRDENGAETWTTVTEVRDWAKYER